MTTTISATKSLLLCLALFTIAAFADPLDLEKQNYNLFKSWTAKHGKQYGVDETPIRYAAWKNNQDYIQQHNAKNLSWKLGLNEFADITPEEFSALHLGFKMPSASPFPNNFPNNFPNIPNFPNFPNFPIFPNNNNGNNSNNNNNSNNSNNSNSSSNGTNPSNNNNSGNGSNGSNGSNTNDVVNMLLNVNISAALDWRNNSIVTPIKNQGQCGACWAFSTTGALEGLYALNKSQLLSFSEQQLVDCSSSYGNQGCNGGDFVSSFQYTQANGIELESDYAYTGSSGTCQYSSSKVVFTNAGNIQVPQNNATLLKHAVNLQPISVAIEADQQAFQLYSSGIISSNCGTSLDHAVLVVGYGTSDGTDYWIVKNQWGTSWGMDGYVQIAAGSQNSGAGVCGINSQPAFPTL